VLERFPITLEQARRIAGDEKLDRMGSKVQLRNNCQLVRKTADEYFISGTQKQYDEILLRLAGGETGLLKIQHLNTPNRPGQPLAHGGWYNLPDF
jgi:hypothetical protein